MGHLPPYPSGEAAPTSHPGSVPAAQKGPRWAQEQLDRRNRALGHASVARAQDILARRYRLECADAAFELLKTSSQQSNVKLHTLADAVVRTPAPDLDARSWRRRPPPAGRSQCGTWAPRPYSTRHPVRPSCRRAAGPPTASPLITVKGHVLGMVSSHHGHPLHGFSRLQLAAFQQTGTDVGRWLSWHWDTVVLDALERLHVQAVGACR